MNESKYFVPIESSVYYREILYYKVANDEVLYVPHHHSGHLKPSIIFCCCKDLGKDTKNFKMISKEELALMF